MVEQNHEISAIFNVANVMKSDGLMTTLQFQDLILWNSCSHVIWAISEPEQIIHPIGVDLIYNLHPF